MGERRVVVSLELANGEATRREGRFTDYALPQRAARSGGVMLGSIGLATLFLPIPVIHLLAIPGILLGGTGLAIRQLSVLGRLAPLRIACPKCGAPNRIGGGLGVRSMAEQTRSCESCRRGLIRKIGTTV